MSEHTGNQAQDRHVAGRKQANSLQLQTPACTRPVCQVDHAPSKNLTHCTISQMPNLRDLSVGLIAFQKVKVLEGPPVIVMRHHPDFLVALTEI